MKPRKLSVQAFGPFVEPQQVDFTRFDVPGLFLIHGPTGAGKTSVLDAICFALYGDTSGGERDPRAMRSDHAASREWVTEVSLEFSLGGACYRVMRRPAQRRPKKRGSGWTEVAAKAELDHLDTDGRWSSVATRPGRVTDAVRERLGFDSNQFRQVIMLPQGRFRELLTARSDAREQILQTLFRTEAYRALADELKRRAKNIEGEARAAALKHETLLQQLEQPSVEALRTHHETLKAEVCECEIEVAGARDQDKRARHALERGKQADAAHQELQQAKQAWSQLNGRTREIEALQVMLESARRAERIRPVENVRLAAEKAVQEATSRLGKLEGERESAVFARDKLQGTLDTAQQRSAEIDALQRRQVELEGLKDKVVRLGDVERQHDALARQFSLMSEQRTGLQGTLERRQSELARCVEQAQQARAVATQLEMLRHRLSLSKRAEQLKSRLIEAKSGAADARQNWQNRQFALDAAEARCEAARSALVRAEEVWRHATATRLAQALNPGEPCPVCGSTEHVLLATPGAAGGAAEPDDPHEQRKMLEQRRGERDEAALACHRAEMAHELAVERIRDVERQFEATSAEDIVASSSELQQQLDEAMRAATQLETLDDAVRRCESDVQKHHSRLAEMVEACSRFEQQRVAVSTEMGLIKKSVPEQLRDPKRLQSAIQETVLRRDQLASALDDARKAVIEADKRIAGLNSAEQSASQALAREQLRLDEACRRFLAALGNEGFADTQHYQSALHSEETMADWQRQIESFRTQCAAAEDRLQRAQRVASETKVPDLPRLQTAADEASHLLETRLLSLDQLRQRVHQIGKTLEVLQAIEAEQARSDHHYALLGRLAEVAGGNNAMRMTFQRFVLATLLDEVLEAASIRLSRMSRNRFELQRVKEVQDQRLAGGLELEVFDHYTGTARPANTLSGGEGFMASLSLALGLADVVQSRAGGTRMEMLFIDEGFGSLDPESLDFALRTLIDLQQSGRLVGIISHVAELRERIDVRLEVVSGPSGSTIRQASS